MDGADQINIFIKERKKVQNSVEKADLIVMVDFNQSNRLGEAERYVNESGAKKVVIDHHLNPENFADIIIADPSKCSTAELVHEIVCEITEEPNL